MIITIPISVTIVVPGTIVYTTFFFYPFCVPIAYKKHLFLKLCFVGLEVLVPAKYSFRSRKVNFFVCLLYN